MEFKNPRSAKQIEELREMHALKEVLKDKGIVTKKDLTDKAKNGNGNA